MNTKPFFCIALVLNGVCQAAIVYPQAPDGGRQKIYEVASQIFQTDAHFLKVSHLEDLSITNSCRSYGVGLKDLSSGHLLSAVEAGSVWQYLLIQGTNAGMAYLSADEKTGQALKCTGIGESDHGMLQALQMAEQLPQVKEHDYEVRALGNPSILFQAVWLHGKSDDIIIPLGVTFGRWNALQPYSEGEMIKLLKPVAKKKLKEPPGMLD